MVRSLARSAIFTRRLAVDVRVIAGTFIPVRCRAAPSSFGTGRFGGRVMKASLGVEGSCRAARRAAPKKANRERRVTDAIVLHSAGVDYRRSLAKRLPAIRFGLWRPAFHLSLLRFVTLLQLLRLLLVLLLHLLLPLWIGLGLRVPLVLLFLLLLELLPLLLLFGEELLLLLLILLFLL